MSNEPAVVLVTGSSRGLGRGVAEELAKAGYSVGIHYSSNHEAAENTVAACQKLATSSLQKFKTFKADLGKKSDRDELIPQFIGAYGRIDGLVNNAGIAPKVRADITELSEDSYDDLLNINLKAPLFISQKAAQHWLKHPADSRLKSGYKLVFITSISAYTASVNRAEYCIAKAGLAMVNQLWATRLANQGVQVVEFRPGIMATDMTSGVKEKYDKLIAEGLVPQGRWGNAEDVGLAVRSFMEGRFPFTTGDAINIDGGFHLRRL